MKKLVILGVGFVSLFLGFAIVHAAEQYFQTTLSMGGNTYLNGSTRNYDYKGFRITGTVTSRDSNLSKQKLYMKLYKVNWLGVTTYQGEGTSNYANKDVYGYDFGITSSSGNKYIYFKTRNANDTESYGAIYSDRTYLTSYN